MNARIQCRTLFDISATGLRGNYTRNRAPFQDDLGQMINNEAAWHRSRNQQRNWETMNQLISLRTLPVDITAPRRETQDGKLLWSFEFEIEDASTLARDQDPLGSLTADCEGVPMILNLDETADLEPCLRIGVNTHFAIQQ